MSDPAGVLNRYEEVCTEVGCEPSAFVVKVLEVEKEEQIL